MVLAKVAAALPWSFKLAVLPGIAPRRGRLPAVPRRIAFDLDDTLIPCRRPFPGGAVRRSLLARALAVEPLREGTRELFAHLRREGYEIWVYTSSQRSAWAVRLQFALYGLWIDGIVNERIHHEAEEKSGQRWPLKYPPAFGIDLLVDNSIMVHRASQKHGFSVIHVGPKDRRWAERVRAGIERRGGW